MSYKEAAAIGTAVGGILAGAYWLQGRKEKQQGAH
jgi:hypothetical protein